MRRYQQGMRLVNRHNHGSKEVQSNNHGAGGPGTPKKGLARDLENCFGAAWALIENVLRGNRLGRCCLGAVSMLLG
eukprot:7886140-Lingulodinium_polyedra.AAC.1